MSDDQADGPAAVVEELESARFVYGAVLDGTDLLLVEWFDDERFEGDRGEILASAVTSTTSDLVPFVVDTEDELDDDARQPDAEALEEAVERGRLESFAALTAIVAEASGYYLLVNREGGIWRRIKHVDPDRFDGEGPIPTSLAGRYVLSAALVDDATDRIADLPDGVGGEDIEIIDWTD